MKEEIKKLAEERGMRMAKHKEENKVAKNIPICQALPDLIHGGSIENMGVNVSGFWNIIGDTGGGKTAFATQALCDITNNVIHGNVEEYSTATNEVLDGEDGNSFDTMGLYGVELNKNPSIQTVEDIYCVISKAIDKNKKKNKGKLVGKNLHIILVDSLDSFASGAILKRGQDRIKAHDKGKTFDEGSYLLDKQKYISTEFFPDLTPRLKDSGVFVIVISQIREKMNVTFGNKIQPTGGKALSFYINQRTLVAKASNIARVVDGEATPIGQLLKLKMLKARHERPGRECFSAFFFTVGIDEVYSNLLYLYDLITDTCQIKNDKASRNLSWQGTSSDELLEATKENIFEFLSSQENTPEGLKKSTSKKSMLEIIEADETLNESYEKVFGSGMDVEALTQYVYANDLVEELERLVLDKWSKREEKLAVVGRRRRWT